MKRHFPLLIALSTLAPSALAASPPGHIAIVFDRSDSMLASSDAACSGVRSLLRKALEEADLFAGLGVQFGSTEILVLGTSATGRAGAVILEKKLPAAGAAKLESPDTVRRIKTAKITATVDEVFGVCRTNSQSIQGQSPIYSATRIAIQWLSERLGEGHGLLILQSDMVETVEKGLKESILNAKIGKPNPPTSVSAFDLKGKIAVYSCGMANSTEKGMEQSGARDRVQAQWRGLFKNPRGTLTFVDQCQGFGGEVRP